MRVLYVQPGHGIGGAKISLARLLCTLPDTQTSLIALSSPADRHYKQMLDGLVEKVHELWLPGWIKGPKQNLHQRMRHTLSLVRRGWYIAPSMHLARLIRQEHIDLVHTNSVVTPVGAIAARLAGRPHIWHVREPVGCERQFPLAPGDWFSARLFKYLSREIICNSRYTAAFFRRHGIQPRVIYNGLDIKQFENGNLRGCQLRCSLGLQQETIVIAMVGSLRAAWKEHDVFLRVASALKDRHPGCQFVLFGGSSDMNVTPYTRSLQEMASALGLADRLAWVGFIDDVPAMMHSFDIMVHPTSNEGSGRVVMEAMAAGKPVVGVRAGGVQELIQDGLTGFLVPPGNVKALSSAIDQLIIAPSLRSHVGAQAQTYARNHFSDDRTTAAIQNLYAEVMNRR